ncbi:MULTISPECIES: VOC family protein [Mumia]|uniref:VOC family protein n=1 Tax=Mumia TaxID=1546255 RepID=UPI001421D252|nr:MULTISPECIES: VOC family protein [unclassified Mumia]QMW66295.1 VOC family protein [Mumia sp. ZJ1417]
MLAESPAFQGFSVDDIPKARDFYADVLGLDVDEEDGMLRLHLAGGRDTLVYPKGDQHEPASYTILNFPVPDVEAAVDGLSARGVVFEKYEGTPMATDEKGVFRGGGPLIAWFTDPAGNVLSVIQE